MIDETEKEGPIKTFEAIVKIRVKAKSKMGASRKLNVMFNTSAVGLRDYEIHEFTEIEDN